MPVHSIRIKGNAFRPALEQETLSRSVLMFAQIRAMLERPLTRIPLNIFAIRVAGIK